MRIFIMGSSGAGKTHLARSLSLQLGLPHLELDSLRHQAEWQPLPNHDFRNRVAAFCRADSWIVDGNYSQVRDIVLSRATDVILLDYPKRIVMSRLAWRSLTRVVLRKKLWNGNRESIRYLLSADPEINVLLWAWTNFDRRRLSFDQLDSRAFTVHRVMHPRDIVRLKRSLKT